MDRETPAFDPSASHHLRPKLRPVRTIGLRHEDRPMLGLRDASQISDRLVVTAPLAQFILGHMDGDTPIDAIVEKAAAQARQRNVPEEAIAQITPEPVQQLVGQLDDAGLLEGPTFDALLGKLRADFDASTHLPPSVTADFADALVVQQVGEDATDDQKADLGPDRLRATFDEFIEKALENAEDPSFDELPRAVVAPHLDYQRGWLNYAHVYGRMRVCDRPDRVIVLGTNHFGRGSGVVACNKGFESPLGICDVDETFLSTVQGALPGDLGERLLADRFDHEREHSIELHVPWIQHVFADPEAGNMPRIVGFHVHDPRVTDGGANYNPGVGRDLCGAARRAAIDATPGRTLVVSSADLSHVGRAFGDQGNFAANDEQGEEMRNRVLQTDRSMIDLLKAGKHADLVNAMRWQQNSTRWCSIGNLVATLRVTDATELEILHYAAAGDQQGQAMVSSLAGVIR